jgi:hypothetical protein
VGVLQACHSTSRKVRPTFTYNYFQAKYTTIQGKDPLPSGPVTLRLDFAYDGGGNGKGGNLKLFVNDKEVADGHLDATVPLGFTPDETVDIGEDSGTPATDTYEGLFPFSGTIKQVVLTIKD